ncbi:MAG: hypothetical protein HQL39_19225 [Alphaproteobacteria bacterium]|nr:hypothetical protein [Alphaproteobacteria bacterium]
MKPHPDVMAWLYAVRLASRPGWRWEIGRLDAPAYADALRQAGLDVREVIVIQDLPTDRAIDPPGTFGFICRGWGQWTYDPAAECWRASDEPMTRPPGAPVPVAAIEATFGIPELGRLPITLTAGNGVCSFDASELHDPFRDMVAWLENVADGRFARLTIDIDCLWIQCHVLPAGDGSLVRFLVDVDERGIARDETVDIDVLVPRRALVKSIYAPLMRFWEGRDLRRAWEEEWCPPVDRPEEEWVEPYRLRSERLDRLIGRG